MDDLTVGHDPDDEAQAGEHAQHPAVDREHLGGEPAHAAAARQRGQMLQQERADAVDLLSVRDGQGDLREVRLAHHHVARRAEQPVLAERTEHDVPQRVRGDHPFDEVLQLPWRRAEERQVPVLDRKALVQLEQGRYVVRPQLAHHHDRAVRQQRHVHSSGPGVSGAAAGSWPCSIFASRTTTTGHDAWCTQ